MASLDGVTARIAATQATSMGEVMAGVRQLAEAGRWPEAVDLIVDRARVSEEELARAVGAPASWVARVRRGDGAPPDRSREVILDMIGEHLRMLHLRGPGPAEAERQARLLARPPATPAESGLLHRPPLSGFSVAVPRGPSRA